MDFAVFRMLVPVLVGASHLDTHCYLLPQQKKVSWSDTFVIPSLNLPKQLQYSIYIIVHFTLLNSCLCKIIACLLDDCDNNNVFC